MSFQSSLRKIIPRPFISLHHLFYAWYGAVKFHHPSDELFVIGVTGTSGKSSTVYWLRQVLEAAGLRVGSLSTIDFYIAGEDKLNDQKMTMLGRMQIQKYLREMVDKKCDVAILEMTSEGAVQHRNKYINVDIMALTNLYPEHIESHGSFDNYKKAKLSIFAYVANSRRKANAKEKVAVVNGRSEYADEFLQYGFEKKIRFGTSLKDILTTDKGITFLVGNKTYSPRIFGEHNASNLACVIAIAQQMGISADVIQNAVNGLTGAPGRMEFISEAQSKGFQVIVDYAFEPVALGGLYQAVSHVPHQRIIHVLGGTGGGRDTSRRGIMGEMAGKNADIVIVTNEDPYDEDPVKIMHMVADGATSAGKVLGKDLFEIEERKEAIQKAINLAQHGDLILITGKGSEQAICVAAGGKIPWDDRVAVRKALAVA